MPSLRPDGSQFYELTDDKIRWLAGTDTAVVISGYVNDDELLANGVYEEYAPLIPGLPQEADPRARVRRNYPVVQRIDAAVRARHPDFDLYAEFEDPGPHVLYAVGRQAEAPLLAKFTSRTETWAEPGDVFAIGGWLLGLPQVPDIALEMQLPAPDTLEECRSLATNWVRRFTDRVFGYRDPFQMMEETRTAPCIGGPLRVVTMTSDSSHLREEIPIKEIPA